MFCKPKWIFFLWFIKYILMINFCVVKDKFLQKPTFYKYQNICCVHTFLLQSWHWACLSNPNCRFLTHKWGYAVVQSIKKFGWTMDKVITPLSLQRSHIQGINIFLFKSEKIDLQYFFFFYGVFLFSTIVDTRYRNGCQNAIINETQKAQKCL